MKLLPDGLLIALDGAAHRSLHTPPQPLMQHRPQLPQVVAHPGQPLHHGRDTPQRPHISGEPVRAGALAQRLLDAFQIRIRQPGLDPSRPLAGQRPVATVLPSGMPAARALLGYSQPAGDLGSRHAQGEQLGRLQAAGLPASSLRAGTGAGGRRVGTSDQGWHPQILPANPTVTNPKITPRPEAR
jgi:hypothetical protein